MFLTDEQKAEQRLVAVNHSYAMIKCYERDTKAKHSVKFKMCDLIDEKCKELHSKLFELYEYAGELQLDTTDSAPYDSFCDVCNDILTLLQSARDCNWLERKG